nr:hypothetical protein [Acidimicrobiia bacterium]
MSYSRTVHGLVLLILLTSAAAVPGTQPAATAQGLAGISSAQEKAISHSQTLQAPEISAEAVTTIHAETDQQRATAEWALEQMAAAGLEIPPVTIHMHSERSDCGNRPGEESNGYYTRRADEHIIHSCGSAWILVHELGHLWDNANLDDETRQRILDYQELESWSHQQWDQAGGEHLASIIAWAIEGTHPSSIGYYDQDHLAKVY